MSCRVCKETLTQKEKKLIRSRGYICLECYKSHQKKYYQKRKKANKLFKEWV